MIKRKTKGRIVMNYGVRGQLFGTWHLVGTWKGKQGERKPAYTKCGVQLKHYSLYAKHDAVPCRRCFPEGDF